MSISVDITNVTLQWNPIPCLQQNGQIVSYRVVYYSNSSAPEKTKHQIASNIMQFTAVGLQPQTMYRFEVNGVSTLNDNTEVHGPAAMLTVTTSQPQGISTYYNIIIIVIINLE